MRKKFLLFSVMVSLCLLIPCAYAKEKEPLKAPGIALEDSKGQFTMLSSILSQSNVVISFWSYDCVPCRKEMPELQKLGGSELFKSKNVKIVYVYVEATTEKSQDSGKPPKEKALEVLQNLQIKEMCLMDVYGVAFNKYREVSNIKAATMPLMYVVNKNKEIIFTAVGYNEQNLKNLETAIKKNL